MEVYFDNSATTRVLDSVKDLMVKLMTDDYANPAAKHKKGMQAENYIKEARAEIAKSLKVQDKEILFTSGGSESNNTALIGTAMANRRIGKHIISSNIEHASIYNPLGYLAEQGFEITYLPVDHLGHISLEQLEAAIRPDTILVSVMYVNNEVGSVEPVEEISQVIKKKNPQTLFHVDAIQAYGKYRIRPKHQ
ncbi:MAG: aminotransferase class V-fold PLP-dependent enzyme, partial [Hungatella sp.]